MHTVDCIPAPFVSSKHLGQLKDDKNPYIVYVASTSGARAMMQMMVISALEEHFFRSRAVDHADLFFGTSGGALALITLSGVFRDNKLRSAAEVQNDFNAACKMVLNADFTRTFRMKNPAKLETAENIFSGFFGDRRLYESHVPIHITAYERKKRDTIYLSSKAPQTKDIPVMTAATATMAVPLLFRPQRYEDMILCDGFRQASFPIQAAIQVAQQETLGTDRPIVVIGIASCFKNANFSSTSILCKSGVVRNVVDSNIQIPREIQNFNNMKARGIVDGVILHADASKIIPDISESLFNTSVQAIADMARATGGIMHLFAPELDRLQKKYFSHLTV